MKVFKAILFGLLMPLVVFAIIYFVMKFSGSGSSSMPLPKSFYLYSYPVMFIAFAVIEYFSLCRKERRREEEEEEQQKREELEDMMRQYLTKKQEEDGDKSE